jgi:hypothetical protein
MLSTRPNQFNSDTWLCMQIDVERLLSTLTESMFTISFRCALCGRGSGVGTSILPGKEGLKNGESIALSSLMRIVPGSTTRGAVYQRSNLLELRNDSTSSRIATDYHWLAYLNFDPWVQV